ncbi:hypothetical protein [Nonomuraea diastatica]|uniref:Uncharacterized protein n=1 Tax=Nonomuraea diastatica TaxID=1848329 RepID=A0A4R4W3Q7_9ACTN|nr:hypothetical protein [Nonomuraea diastatica]TDD13219.1 hypothetical protein E1294_41825 [Nonomuraea diastatica]
MVWPDVVGQLQAAPNVVDHHLGDLVRGEKARHLWKHFNASTSAKHDSGLPVRFSAQSTSSGEGVKNTCSTRADVSRLNRG